MVAELIELGMICYTELLWQLLIDKATHAPLPVSPRVSWPPVPSQILGRHLSNPISCLCLFHLLHSINTDALAPSQTGTKNAPTSGLWMCYSLWLKFSSLRCLHNVCPQFLYFYSNVWGPLLPSLRFYTPMTCLFSSLHGFYSSPCITI